MEGGMATAALVILGLVLAAFGIGGFVFGQSEASIWLIVLGVVALIAAGSFQMLASRRP
jgi:hypothetical protein